MMSRYKDAEPSHEYMPLPTSGEALERPENEMEPAHARRPLHQRLKICIDNLEYRNAHPVNHDNLNKAICNITTTLSVIAALLAETAAITYLVSLHDPFRELKSYNNECSDRPMKSLHSHYKYGSLYYRDEDCYDAYDEANLEDGFFRWLIGAGITITIVCLAGMAIACLSTNIIRNEASDQLSFKELPDFISDDVTSLANEIDITIQPDTDLDDIITRFQAKHDESLKIFKRKLFLSGSLEKNKGSALYSFFHGNDKHPGDGDRQLTKMIFKYAGLSK